MANPLDALSEKLTALASLRATAIKAVQEVKGANEAQFDFTAPIPTVNRSPAEIETRITGTCGIFSGTDSDVDPLMIPQTAVASLIKPVDQLTSLYKKIIDDLNGIRANGGPGTLDPRALTLQSKNGKANLQLATIFQNIWNNSETLLVSAYPFLHLIRGEGYADFSTALRTFTEALEQVHAQRQELSNLMKESQADRRKISEFAAQSGPLREEIERLKTESEKDRKTLAEYTSEGTQSITSIRSTAEQSEQMKTSVESYKVTFDNFQKQLDQREHAIQQGTKRQDELLQGIDEIEDKINKLNEQAEAMLSGATVAGLAGSFGKLRDNLSAELTTARKAFYFAIFLLFLSVIPLAGYVIPVLGDWLSLAPSAEGNAPTTSALELVIQILARALLLLPAAWFAKFAAARHAALFRLKEHYAYKYSIASSVEGFKKQAEPFKDAIAATTFFELTFNPADRMDSKGQEDRHPNPAMEWIMKKLGTTYDGSS